MNRERKDNSLIAAIIAFALVLLAWIVNWLFLVGLPSSERGTFGDMFGAANSIFSGLAFAGVVYAIFLQRGEISIAREELKQTKAILSDQKAQLERQNDATAKQSFENTYFQLLSLVTQITNSMDLESGALYSSPSQSPYTGKDVFPVFLRRLADCKRQVVEKDEFGDPTKFQNVGFDEAFSEFFSRNGDELGYYIRVIYRTLVFVDNAEIENKKFYTNLLRAQLSDSEVRLLMYICASNQWSAKLRPIAEKYRLFLNLDSSNLAFPEALNAFGKP